LVGNYDTQLATGNAFLYDIPTGTYTNIDKPGTVSTTAYGVWGNQIVGSYGGVGAGDGLGVVHGYIFNETTSVYTTYDHPGSVATHFDGISGGGQAGTYNLIGDWVSPTGQTTPTLLHIDAQGNRTWIDLGVPGATTTSANSIYEGTVVGVYTDSSGVHGYTVAIPGIYNPLFNGSILTTAAANSPGIVGQQGDDVLNIGTIATSGVNSPGIRAETYGVVTNNGAITVTGAGSAAVELDGSFGTLLNNGTLSAAAGAYAIAGGVTASGSLVVNDGLIDGAVDLSAGPYARFENSGWLGISAPGWGTTHLITGTFVQTDLGTLQLRVAGGGGHDALLVVGTAGLRGSLTLATQPGVYANQTVYTNLVSATGGITGGFATVGTTSPFLAATLSTGGNAVSAVLTRLPFNSLPGLTPNQQAVGNGLEQGYRQAQAGGAGASLYGSILGTGASASALPAAYDSLSGEGLTGSLQTLFLVGSTFVAAIQEQDTQWLMQPSVVADETAAIAPGTWRGWSVATGGGGHLGADAASGAAHLDFDSWGGIAGIDYAVAPNVLVGVALGGSGSSFSVSDRQTTGSAGGGEGGVYAIGRWGGFYGAGTLAYGRYNIDTTRTVSALGMTATPKASFDDGVLTGRLEGGYRFATAFANLTPYAAYQPAWIGQPGFSESVSAAGANVTLSVQSKSAASQPISIGLQIDRSYPVGEAWTLAPTGRVAWVHEFTTGRTLTASLSAAPGASFEIAGPSPPCDTALLSGTLYAMHGPRLALLASITAGLSGAGEAVGGHIGVQLAW
jgi:subtilase-type serine protease